MTIAPIIRTVRTRAAPPRAFDVFTRQMGQWWPKGGGLGGQPLQDMVVEPFEGGRWFERDIDGAETQWGKVLEWSPPDRLLLAWQIDAERRYDPELVTEVELVFEGDAAGGTTLTLTHRYLERLGRKAEAEAAAIAAGWSKMVELFAQAAGG